MESKPQAKLNQAGGLNDIVDFDDYDFAQLEDNSAGLFRQESVNPEAKEEVSGYAG